MRQCMFHENVLICYGAQLGYHHGAKYQLLRSLAIHGSEPKFCIVTDRPELFEGYPCRTLTLGDDHLVGWSLNNRNHFGIKLKGLEWAANTSNAENILLLDTDMYWKRNPKDIIKKLDQNTFALYRNEGNIFDSKNKSIQKFEISLTNKTFPLRDDMYRVSKCSQMWGSAIIGLATQNSRKLAEAFELFEILDSHVEAHTVEQFALAEVLRIGGFKKIECRNYVSDWSSIGRKKYATPVLANFFNTYGENAFETHVKHVSEIKIKRPFGTLISQKIERWKSRKSQS